jgi:predicted aminopeptidase
MPVFPAVGRVGLAVGLLLVLTGCQAGYYWHLARGHTALMRERVPVETVLADPATPAALRERLAAAGQMLTFADTALSLPVDDAYRTFVALERGFVVWNLFAAPAFSLTPETWCFPVAGCSSYRGYFDLERAERDAARLRDEGLDVYGGGAVAYSTLGWFSDPLTTPMLHGTQADVAELLFHELAHRRFYLPGDTRFNESLATSVGREGARRWLAAHGDPALMGGLQDSDRARATVMALVQSAREDLATLYASPASESGQRAGKATIQARLREDYRAALALDPSLAPYQRWFDGPLNNAQLNTLSDYNQWVPAFDALLLHCGGQWACFWQAVEQLADLPPPARTAQLNQWMTP